ncbi:MlaC/ttg2D family ABC transporter substrate-binding protein [Cellvibrio sp. ARAG 10.3]|uniref:MlaC/ttg2D family ABC transporter substrate-binding protein n=1 Tax=Cellvibrio sp. ARAG 10.3 TaxID=3451358 RepID=UPI003F471EE4
MKTNWVNSLLHCYRCGIIGILLCILPWVSCAESTAAQVPDPAAVMKVAIDDVLTQLKNHEALYKNNPQQLRVMVADTVLPHFNVARIAQLALAQHWRNTTAPQRDAYVREFQRYLIRTYTETLFIYRNTKAEMLGTHYNDKDNQKATLKLRATNEKGEPVILFLRLELKDDNWKIVDINVEGVSLVITTRGVFDEEIKKVGLDAFLSNLTEKNNRAEGSVDE